MYHIVENISWCGCKLRQHEKQCHPAQRSWTKV